MLRTSSLWVRFVLRRKVTVGAVASLGLFLAGVLSYAGFAASPDAASHALSHVLGGTLAALLVIAVLHLKRPRRAFVRAAWTVFVVSFSVFAIGQLAESIGAFGEEDKYLALNTLHDMVVFVPSVALFIAFMAVPWLVTGLLVRNRSNPGAPVAAVNIALDAAVAAVFVYLVVTGQ